MSKVRVCFLGTPEFAVTSLKALIDDDHFEVVGVVTQPDRPAGRKMQLTPSPVKMLAMNHGMHVITPESLKKNPQRLDEIRSWGAEVAVVVAFGQILTQEFLDMFPFGAVNVHGSILPRWRGAAPIQRGIEAGDKESGVTLQKMVKKLDAGDIIGIRRVALDDEITAMELHDKLAVLGADLLRVELMDYVRGNLVPHPQDEAQVTYAHKIDKAESEIKWMLPAVEIHNKIRALTMGPGTYTWLGGKKLKIHKTRVSEKAGSHPEAGFVHDANDEYISVQCGGGILNIFEVQPESRNRMKVSDFLKGHRSKREISSVSKLVAPSILSADFANLEKELKAISVAGADWVHVDVMDGHFVPNLTIGIPVVESLKKVTSLPLDVHLMIEKPERYVEDFIKAGSDYLTIHVEATEKPHEVLRQIRSLGAKAGITLRPGTPLSEIIPYLGECDLVLVMTVEPGFGGQSFMMDQVEKMKALREERERRGLKYLIEVDGGVNEKTLAYCKDADVLVAGSYVFRNDYKKAIESLKV